MAVVISSILYCFFASFMVLGKNILHKILIPAVQFGLYQLQKMNISTDIIIMILNVMTLGLIVAMFQDRFFPERSQQLADQNNAVNSTTVAIGRDENIHLVELFSMMLISSLLISFVMESRQLIRQTNTFAHVFNGKNHRQMRNKILRTIDKTFIINSLVFIT